MIGAWLRPLNNELIFFILKENVKMTKAITKNSKKGFTLVELVIVIAILAILAAIAIPVVNSIINTASRNGALSDAQTIELAIKECQADIAARNDEVYNGTSTYIKADGSQGKLPQASKNSSTHITVVDVAGAKSINNAFGTVTYNGADFAPFWDKEADKCVYLCTVPDANGKVASNAELGADTLTAAYPNATTQCVQIGGDDASTGVATPLAVNVDTL